MSEIILSLASSGEIIDELAARKVPYVLVMDTASNERPHGLTYGWCAGKHDTGPVWLLGAIESVKSFIIESEFSSDDEIEREDSEGTEFEV